jgi:hypothetical protein
MRAQWFRRTVAVICLSGIGCSSDDPGASAAGADASIDQAESAAPDSGAPDTAIPDVGSDAFPAPVPDDCLTDVTAGQHTFQCEGLAIEVFVPDGCIEAPCGVILDLHGLYMCAADEEANLGLRALAPQYGFIIVQPTAPGKSWNKVMTDIPEKIVQRVVAAWHADTRRIHVTGFSQGGFFTWDLLCSAANLFASYAPAAGYSFCSNLGEPRDMLFLAGRKDAVVSYDKMQASRDKFAAQPNSLSRRPGRGSLSP